MGKKMFPHRDVQSDTILFCSCPISTSGLYTVDYSLKLKNTSDLSSRTGPNKNEVSNDHGEKKRTPQVPKVCLQILWDRCCNLIIGANSGHWSKINTPANGGVT